MFYQGRVKSVIYIIDFIIVFWRHSDIFGYQVIEIHVPNGIQLMLVLLCVSLYSEITIQQQHSKPRDQCIAEEILKYVKKFQFIKVIRHFICFL